MRYLATICVLCILSGCQPSEQKQPFESRQPAELIDTAWKPSDNNLQETAENENTSTETIKETENIPDKTTIPPVSEDKNLPMETVAEQKEIIEDIVDPVQNPEAKKETAENNDVVDITGPVFTETETDTIKAETEKPDISSAEPVKPGPVGKEVIVPEKETQNLNDKNQVSEKTLNSKEKKPEFYQKYEELLKKYIDKNGNVDYMSLRRKRAELYETARAFEKMDISIEDMAKDPENEQIAFWINAHNIFTLKLIIENYPIKRNSWLTLMYPDIGIMHIPGGRDKVYFKILSREYTLREIEKEILMDTFKDPRIPFTLTYATTGGAFLRNEPYYPETLDQQLDQQVKRFLSSPKGLKIDKSDKIVYLADIFIWYKQYFIEQYSDVKKFRNQEQDIRSYLNFIIKYIPKEDVQFLENNDFSIKFMKYDWKLNDQQL